MDKIFDAIVVVLIVLMVIWLLIPGGGTVNKAGTALTVWVTYSEAEFKIYKELCKKFEEDNKIKLNIQLIPWGGHQNKLRTACNTKTAPDIARIDLALTPLLALGKAIEPLDSYGVGKYKKIIVDAAFDTNIVYNMRTKKNNIYGLPDKTDCVALFYNKKHFRDVGLSDKDVPKTWEEFVEVGKKLTVDNDKDGLIDRYAFGMNNSLWWTFPFFNSFGAVFINDQTGECLLNSPKAIAALQFKKDLFSKYKIEAGAWQSGAVEPKAGFLNDKYSMILCGPWLIADCENSGMDFGIARIPAGPAGSFSNIGGSNMVIFKTCRDKKLAYKFLEFMVSDYFQVKWCTSLKQIPVNKKLIPELKKKLGPRMAVFLDQILSTRSRPKIPRYGMLEDAVNQEMGAALQGQKDVKQALTDSKIRCDEIVKQIFEE
ncbi:extracellular solute-binding protein [bacterium]|nr:extracellular solute-binding protein [bacterium]